MAGRRFVMTLAEEEDDAAGAGALAQAASDDEDDPGKEEATSQAQVCLVALGEGGLWLLSPVGF
jgi:hypothetical protein